MAIKFNASIQVKKDNATIITVPVDDATWSSVETKVVNAINAYTAAGQAQADAGAEALTAFNS